MSTGPEYNVLAASAALAEAAASAGYAPSIHNTQPWRWRVEGDTLELYAEFGRQLSNTDPGGRLLALSCGAALHHARVALAAEGWLATVERMPDPQMEELLARLTVTGRTPVTTEAMRKLQTVRVRHTDRRPVSDVPVPAEAVKAISVAFDSEGARLHVLRPDDVLDLAVVADRAQTLEAYDPQWREEIAYWAGAAHPEGLGIPDSAIPREGPKTTVPSRNFGHAGDLPVSAGHDRAAIYGILYGDMDTPLGWLRAGEALSAAWLTATEAGVSVLPMSAAVEVETTRQLLRRILSKLGDPFLVVRLGLADPDQAGPPRTPRLPAAQTVEVIDPNRET